MIEAAYVLPVMMVVVLLIVDVVVYASDRLYANDVMADAYHLFMAEAAALSSDPTLTVSNVQCSDGHVSLNEAEAKTTVANAFTSIFPGFNSENLTISVVSSTGIVPQVFVMDVSFTSQTIFLPEAFAKSFPVKAKLILSFDLGC